MSEYIQYSENLYGDALYADNEKGIDVDGEKYIDLMKYLPWYYQESATTIEIMMSIGKELYTLSVDIEDFKKQLFISTATWGLRLWEEELNLPTRLDLPYIDRREIIKAKLRGRGTTTLKMIKNTAEAFSGGEVDVIEHNDKYYFVIKFIGQKGIPRNLEAFKAMIDVIKPAHLGYQFEFILITYGMLKNNLKVTHGELKNNGITYRGVKEYRVNEINEVI